MDAFGFFDKGVTIAVLIAVAWVGGVMLRRWLQAIDAQELRDAKHLQALEQHRKGCHEEIMMIQKHRIERDERTAVILESISESLKLIRSELQRRQTSINEITQ